MTAILIANLSVSLCKQTKQIPADIYDSHRFQTLWTLKRVLKCIQYSFLCKVGIAAYNTSDGQSGPQMWSLDLCLSILILPRSVTKKRATTQQPLCAWNCAGFLFVCFNHSTCFFFPLFIPLITYVTAFFTSVCFCSLSTFPLNCKFFEGKNCGNFACCYIPNPFYIALNSSGIC